MHTRGYPGRAGPLFRDPHAEKELDLLPVPQMALEIEQIPIFNARGDGNGEDADVPVCVKPNIPLRPLFGLFGGNRKIVEGKIASIGNKTGRPCSGPLKKSPSPSESPSEASPSAAKSRAESRLEGIAPRIEGVTPERSAFSEGIASQIVPIPLVPVA